MKFTHWFVQRLLGLPKFPGRDFLIEKAPKWLLPSAPKEIAVQSRFGFEILLHPTNDINIENLIYERGVYELGTVSILQQFLKPGDTFIDVGANIGFLSLVASRIVGKNGLVHSFEAVSDTSNLLQDNIHRNSIGNISTHTIGLSDKAENRKIYLEEGNRGGASMTSKRSEQFFEVECKSLDSILPDLDIHLLKIDVEGMEFNVLKGAREIIQRSQPIIIVEYSNDRKNESDPIEMYRWLKALCLYRFYKLKRGKERKGPLVEISLVEDLPTHDNLICIPINR